MPITVDATVGGTNSNSYQTVAEIDTYFTKRIPTSVASQWFALTADQKAAAAIQATIWMETLIHWSHYPTSPDQALLWPQYGQWMRSGWKMVPQDVIPQELKNFHAEVALYLTQDDRISDFDPIKYGIRKIKAGSVDIEFREKIPVQEQPPVIPATLYSLLVDSWIDYIEDEPSGMREVQRA